MFFREGKSGGSSSISQAGRSKSRPGRDRRPSPRKPRNSGGVNWKKDFTTSAMSESSAFGRSRRLLTNTWSAIGCATALDTDEDQMSAMARELVEKAGVGESADAVWRDLGHEREKVLPRPVAVEPESEDHSASALDPPGLIATDPVPTPFGIHLIDANLSSKKRKKDAIWPSATETNVQLSLFD